MGEAGQAVLEGDRLALVTRSRPGGWLGLGEDRRVGLACHRGRSSRRARGRR